MRRSGKARGAIVLATAGILASISGSAMAQVPQSWDGGSGLWSTSAPNWDGGTNAWTQGNHAVFGPPIGTVTLGENISVGTMTFNSGSDGYVIDLAGNTLLQTGNNSFFSNANPTPPSVDPTTIEITSSSGGTYVFAGSSAQGPILGGNIDVTFNGGSGWVPFRNNTFTGDLTLEATSNASASQVRPLRNSAFGSSSGLIKLGGSTYLAFGVDSGLGMSHTYTRDIELIGNNQRIGVSGMREITLSGDISGSGAWTQLGSQGKLLLTGNNSHTGAMTISGANLGLVVGSNDALGSTPSVTISAASSLGFQGGVNVGATPVALNSSTPVIGLGMIHNYSGNNTFAGNISMGSNTVRTFSAEDGSTLTLTGNLTGSKGLAKLGGGTLVLTGANTFPTANASAGNETDVRDGVLRLDFSQSSVTTNIINNGISTNGTGNTISHLVLSGGTLEVKGKAGETNSQSFKNYNSSTLDAVDNMFTVAVGASSVRAIQNDAASLTISLGKLSNRLRLVGGTIDFTVPTAGAIVLPAQGINAVGTSNTILTANGAAFATVNGSEWAALDSGRNIVAGSSVANFYTANTASSLTGNADMSGGNTTLSGDAQVTSLRFNNNASSRTIDANGNVLTTGGILVTPSVGSAVSTITGGTLRGNDSASGTLQDLVIIQNNPAGKLVISSSITNAANGNATGLTKTGPGVLELTGANSYTGATNVTGGVLKLSNASALGSGNTAVKGGGVIGLTAESGNFAATLGSGAGQFRWLGSGGFAAYDGTRTVMLTTTETGNRITWHATSGAMPTLSRLILGAADADGTIDFQNNIRTQDSNNGSIPYNRIVQVENGSAAIDAILSGVITGEAGIAKAGAGTLVLSNVNTYIGPTVVDAGRLLVNGSLSSSSSVTVNSGATLGGAGSVNGPISVAAGGTISPGNGAGNLSVGSLGLAGGSISLFEIDGLSTGQFDTITASGSVAFGGTLALDFASDFGEGTWDLFNFTSSSGNFSSIVDISGNYDSSLLSFDPSTGVLTASVIPEPASLGLLALGSVVMLRRRRIAR